MQIGFLTTCLRGEPLPEVLRWAGANGFRAIELDAGIDRPTLDVDGLDSIRAAEIREAARAAGLTLSALGFYANMISPDAAERDRNQRHMERVINAATLLDVDNVCCLVGRDSGKTIDENFEIFGTVFGEAAKRAADGGVRLALENWPGLGRQSEGMVGNLACSPVLWRRMFEMQPDLGLCFDPSHLVWTGVDYLKALREFAGHIFHVHAKDTEIDDAALRDAGILLQAPQWHRYRLPGRGEVKWGPLIAALRAIGYQGALSIEQEDPDYSGGGERVKEGLVVGRQFLEGQLGAGSG